MTRTILLEELDPENITLDVMRASCKETSKFVAIYDSSGKRLRLQIGPELDAEKIGGLAWTRDDGRNVIDVDVDSAQTDAVYAFENKMKDLIVANAEMLFGRPLDRDTVESMYKSSIAPSRTQDAHSMRLKLPRETSKVSILLLEGSCDGTLKYSEGGVADLRNDGSSISGTPKLIPVVDVSTLWIMNEESSAGLAGVSFTISSIIVTEKVKQKSNCPANVEATGINSFSFGDVKITEPPVKRFKNV